MLFLCGLENFCFKVFTWRPAGCRNLPCCDSTAEAPSQPPPPGGGDLGEATDKRGRIRTEKKVRESPMQKK